MICLCVADCEDRSREKEKNEEERAERSLESTVQTVPQFDPDVTLMLLPRSLSRHTQATLAAVSALPAAKTAHVSAPAATSAPADGERRLLQTLMAVGYSKREAAQRAIDRHWHGAVGEMTKRAKGATQVVVGSTRMLAPYCHR